MPTVSRATGMIVVGSTLLVAVALFVHVPFLNGPSYWQWPWRSLPFARVALLTALGAVPFGIAQYRERHDRGSTLARLVLLASSTLALELLLLGAASSPFTLADVWRIVKDPQATSYFTDAVMAREESLSLPAMTDHLPILGVHSQTKPPGPILYYRAMLQLFQKEATAGTVGGLLLGLLAAASAPATYGLARTLEIPHSAAFQSASVVALCPGLILFFPEFDPTFTLFTSALLATWAVAQRRSVTHSIAFGALLAASTLLTYGVLTLGVWVVGYSWLRLDGQRRSILRRIVLAAVGFLLVSFMAWRLTGFDPLRHFISAWHRQQQLAASWKRPYWPAVLFDLFDFGLGAGWATLLLGAIAAMNSWRRRKQDALASLCLLACIQIVAVDMSGILRVEAARVWLFLVPLLALPAGLELAQWPRRSRLAVHGALLILLAAMAANLTYIKIEGS